MRSITRRQLLALAGGVVASQLIPTTSYAAEEEEKVLVTEQVALEIGTRFFQGVSGLSGIVASSAFPIFNTAGEGVAFLVEAELDQSPYGYAIFNPEANLGVAEFSIGDQSISPRRRYENGAIQERSASSESVLLQFDSLTYGEYDPSSSLVFDNYGNVHEMTLSWAERPSTRSENPTQWEDANVLLDVVDVYKDYNIAESRILSGYVTPDDMMVMASSKKYGCGVSAGYCESSYYVPMGNLGDDYNELWDCLKATVYEVENGISKGSVLVKNQGPGVVEFCARRGKSLSYQLVPSADWTLYRNCINGGNMVHFAGQLGSNASSAHGMAVMGHMTLTNKNDILDFMHALVVYDGWHPGVRILNHNTSHYGWHYGIFFSQG